MASAKLRNFSHEYYKEMTSLTYSKYRVVDLLHFPMVATMNKQGGHVTSMWLTALSSAISVL